VKETGNKSEILRGAQMDNSSVSLMNVSEWDFYFFVRQGGESRGPLPKYV